MGSCRTLLRISLSSLHKTTQPQTSFSLPPISTLSLSSLLPNSPRQGLYSFKTKRICLNSIQTAIPIKNGDFTNEIQNPDEKSLEDTVEQILKNPKDVSNIMIMERKVDDGLSGRSSRWFPYLDRFVCGDMQLSSAEVLEALEPHMMETRKERFRNLVRNRSYSVCLVVEGLSDFGNVSATFRSAEALGIQSVHVVACDSSKRYRNNRHVSMGAEKWLDIELWDTPKECFTALKSRGYRIATTHVGMDVVGIYDMDWSCPTAIVVGNELRGISDEALKLSDMHCSIPMKGMVDSFNVSVAAGIIMHHAVFDRTARLGSHCDLSPEESQILLAEFSLRHSQTAISIAHEFAKRKISMPMVTSSV